MKSVSVRCSLCMLQEPTLHNFTPFPQKETSVQFLHMNKYTFFDFNEPHGIRVSNANMILCKVSVSHMLQIHWQVHRITKSELPSCHKSYATLLQLGFHIWQRCHLRFQQAFNTKSYLETFLYSLTQITVKW